MAKKNSKKKGTTRVDAVGMALIAIGLILAAALFFGGDAILVKYIRLGMLGLMGILGWILPFMCIGGGILLVTSRRSSPGRGKLALGIATVMLLETLVHIFSMKSSSFDLNYFKFLTRSVSVAADFGGTGGLAGALLSYPLVKLMGAVCAVILSLALTVICIVLLTGFSPSAFFAEREREPKQKKTKIRSKDSEPEYDEYDEDEYETDEIQYEEQSEAEANAETSHSRKLKPKEKKSEPEPELDEILSSMSKKNIKKAQEKAFEYTAKLPSYFKWLEIDAEDEAQSGELKVYDYKKHAAPDLPERFHPARPGELIEPHPARDDINDELLREQAREVFPEAELKEGAKEDDKYEFPPLELLEPSRNAADPRARTEIRERSDKLESTLASFGVKARVIDVSRGPVVTRYELQPAPGVKVSRIVNLADDIALNLASQGVRIEAPIPGKAAVGIEVPNAKRGTVTGRDIIDSAEFREIKSKLGFALGMDISGSRVLADLAKMPHLLIAGATGSGKSVCVNGIIISILYHAKPEDVQFIMVDPKVVELSGYNGIPHLKVPVVTEPKRAAGALAWAVNEMERRYALFSASPAKEIERYNKYAKENQIETLPKLVIIIDELADLMMVSSKEVEAAICRIAQKGRASGIHLVVATQRPSVDVITGLIKANIPARIALTVSSGVDSRTILDMHGAEKLLGKGDMLFKPGDAPKPIRVQGCWISEDEIASVIEFLKRDGEATYDTETQDAIERAIPKSKENPSTDDGADLNGEDELLEKAVRLALEYEQVSISMLQRRLRVGYARAARLVDEMEQRGYVSPADGSKPRQILISWNEFEQICGGENE